MLAAGDATYLDDPVTRELIDEGMAAAPKGFLGEDVLETLPKHVVKNECRLCGKVDVLTKEHIPPRNSGNKSRYSSHSIDEWIERSTLEIPERGKVHQGGIYGFTLCSVCNSLTGRLYGNEYKKWAYATVGAMNVMPKFTSLDEMIEPLVWTLRLGSSETGGVRPGSLVRQVLSMMCSLSGSWDLAGTFPEIRRIVLEQSTEPLSAKLRLGASLYIGPRIRIQGPQLIFQPDRHAWQWVMEMAYPPFAFLLELDSNTSDFELGSELTDWVKFRPSESRLFESTFRVGSGWTPYPGDYRSRAALEAGDGAQ